MDTDFADIAERREALRRDRLSDPGAAERTEELHESTARVEASFRGTLAAFTGENVEKLRQLGF
jgi:hypothetical protein